MTISTEFNYVLINNETRVLSLDYEIVNENFICMMKTDLDCTILFFDEVSVNSAPKQYRSVKRIDLI
jgi:hypothetical protein